jgi:hypothetical protein
MHSGRQEDIRKSTKERDWSASDVTDSAKVNITSGSMIVQGNATAFG